MSDRKEDVGVRHRELRRPVQFLEEGLNDFKASVKDGMKIIQADLAVMRSQNAELSCELERQKKENHQLSLQYRNSLGLLEKCADKVLVDKDIKAVSDQSARLISDLRKELQEFVNYSYKLQEKVSHVQIDLREEKYSSNSLLKDAEESKAKLSNMSHKVDAFEASSKEHVYRLAQSNDIFSAQMQNQILENYKSVERAEKAVLKADKSLKADAVLLSNDLKNRQEAFLEKISADIVHSNKKMVILKSDFDKLKDDLMRSSGSSAPEKELNDFMKQVGYNARQIAKIQQSLEKK